MNARLTRMLRDMHSVAATSWPETAAPVDDARPGGMQRATARTALSVGEPTGGQPPVRPAPPPARSLDEVLRELEHGIARAVLREIRRM